MSQINRVNLIGHVGADPDLRISNNGTQVATFQLFTNDGPFEDVLDDEGNPVTSKDGSTVQRRGGNPHRIAVFGPYAEQVARHVRKGARIVVNEARLQYVPRRLELADGSTFIAHQANIAVAPGGIIW
jgi:single-strand DNA-binding protein